ncbi:MAG: hypothetical protein HDS73_03655 [Bacteroidales bacterium]|nr:hypothetical protein [Bacteroidales bacterium]
MKAKLAANPTFWALIILGVLILASIAVTWWMPSLNENQTNEEGAPVTIHVAHEITPADTLVSGEAETHSYRKSAKRGGRKAGSHRATKRARSRQSSEAPRTASPLDNKN